jgi:hypothetical protein
MDDDIFIYKTFQARDLHGMTPLGLYVQLSLLNIRYRVPKIISYKTKLCKFIKKFNLKNKLEDMNVEIKDKINRYHETIPY